jgi:hypothetical protein
MLQTLSWAYLVATNERLTQIVGIYLFLYLITICNLNINIVLSPICIQLFVLHMNISRANI